MTRIQSSAVLAAVIGAAFSMALLFNTPAAAQASDPAVTSARASGAIGEQADGYLGFAPGGNVSADVRGRVEQINIQRRSLYTRRAAELSVSVNEMAAAVACEVFQNRIAVGERYRDEGGQWRQRAAGQAVAMPSFCP